MTQYDQPQTIDNSDIDRLTKILTAQRQLDAAIRMFLSFEDDLAIHTVGAAAYRVLRDLKAAQGKTELTDILSEVVFNVAQKIVNGEFSGLPAELSEKEEIGRLILSLTEAVRAGEVSTSNEVFITFRHEKEHWGSFNKVANFLKHADTDTNAMLNPDLIKNDLLLEYACRCYVRFTGSITPEMITFFIWRMPDEGMFQPIIGTMSRELSLLELDARRTRCLDILRELKNNEEAACD